MLSIMRANPSRAVARVDLPVDESLHDVDEFGADPLVAARVDDVADVGERQALLAGQRIVAAVDDLGVVGDRAGHRLQPGTARVANSLAAHPRRTDQRRAVEEPREHHVHPRQQRQVPQRRHPGVLAEVFCAAPQFEQLRYSSKSAREPL